MNRKLTPEEQERVDRLEFLSSLFVRDLKGAGVENYAISVYSPIAEDLKVLSRVAGTSDHLLNMIASLALNLMPDDFQRLLAELTHNAIFAHLRVLPTPQQSTTVN